MDAREIVETMWKKIETGALDELPEVVAEDCISVNGGVRTQGIPQLREMLKGYVDAFEMAHSLVAVFRDAEPTSDGSETVAVQLHVSGKHVGPMVTPMGEVPATGNTFELDSVDVVTITDGKITSWLAYYDPTPIYAAIGLVPA